MTLAAVMAASLADDSEFWTAVQMAERLVWKTAGHSGTLSVAQGADVSAVDLVANLAEKELSFVMVVMWVAGLAAKKV